MFCNSWYIPGETIRNKFVTNSIFSERGDKENHLRYYGIHSHRPLLEKWYFTSKQWQWLDPIHVGKWRVYRNQIWAIVCKWAINSWSMTHGLLYCNIGVHAWLLLMSIQTSQSIRQSVLFIFGTNGNNFIYQHISGQQNRHCQNFGCFLIITGIDC